MVSYLAMRVALVLKGEWYLEHATVRTKANIRPMSQNYATNCRDRSSIILIMP